MMEDFGKIIGVYGGLTIGSTRNLQLIKQGRRIETQPGDYMYRSTSVTWDIEQGMWGIMRLLGQENSQYRA